MSDIEQSLKSLRIADLELFVTAAQWSNLGKSAKIHHLSQSAASTAVQRVEAAFGILLCMHEKRKFKLTRAGMLLLPKMEHWLQQLTELVINQETIPIRLATTHAIAQVATAPILNEEVLHLKLMRPNLAYKAILHDEADIALVLDNTFWKGVTTMEMGSGYFQLYANQNVEKKAILLPEDQMEVLSFQQRWKQMYHTSPPIKARIPSWALIADICANSSEVGFLPDFLAKKFSLTPVSWQPTLSKYRVLAIYRDIHKDMLKRFDDFLHALCKIFSPEDLQENSIENNTDLHSLDLSQL